MADTATVGLQASNPKTRPDDARGTPPGEGTVRPAHGGQIGNPPFVPTDEKRRDVEAWVRAGLTEDDIAILLECSRSTVRRHFERELKMGQARLKVAMGGKAVKMALEGDRTMLIFWLRTKAKWNVRVEHTGADGGPIRTYDLSQFDSDQKRLLLTMIDQMIEQHGGEEANGDSAQPTTH
jgi:hypothetical protein